MTFHSYSRLKGKHAVLSPSRSSWMNFDEERLRKYLIGMQAKKEGVEDHELAERLIRRRRRLPDIQETFNMYVNDAIGFRMTPEQTLYYSDNIFGTADAISFRNNKLRIHDLKTGVKPAHMEQLLAYAALFCLEYGYNPADIEIELRIYQNDAIESMIPTVDDILPVMDQIVTMDRCCVAFAKEVGYE